MQDVWEHVTLATILQKYLFDHNFLTKAVRMTVLVSRSMLSLSKNLKVKITFKVMTFVISPFGLYLGYHWA